MEPWIDPREHRARWYFATLLVLGIGTLIAMVFLLMLAEMTPEEDAIALVTAFLSLLGAILAALKLRQLPHEFRQQEGTSETTNDAV
jgi:hypothetical protein